MPHTQSQEGLSQEVVQTTPTHGEPVYIAGVPPWIATLLTVGGLVIAAVLLSLLVNRDTTTVAEPAPTVAATPAPTVTVTAAAAPAGTGIVYARDDPILPLPAEGLAPYASRTIRGDAVPVQSVVADEGFWVGTSEVDRLYVIYQTGGFESPPDVDAGQRVSFVGWLEAATTEVDAPQYRLTEAEGLGQLLTQGYYIETGNVEVIADGPEEAD